MKYLKGYNLFENSGNTSFDWLRKQNNEKYFDLMDILVSDVFEEFNIVSKTDESFEMGTGEEGYPEHKFWVFRLKDKQNTNDDISDINSIGDGEIKEIIVYNIPPDETTKFWEACMNCEKRVNDYLDKKLVIKEEPVGTPECPEYFDYIISLANQ